MSNLRPALLVILVAACGYPKSAAAPGPISPGSEATAATTWPGTTPESLQAGRATFLANCNRCHGYPDVTAIPEAKWPGIVKRMGGKAKLTPQQTDEVLHFILAARVDASAR